MIGVLLALLAQGAGSIPAVTLSPGECMIVQPLGGSADVYGGAECDRRTLPASTFKVPHALIALQTGAIAPDVVLKWDGRPKDFPAWERDHTLDSAIKWSVVWFFQRLANAIGRDRELEYLKNFRYGSQMFNGPVDEFWLNGALTISPREQIAFLSRMMSYGLPVERRHVETVKTAMTMPAGKLTNGSGVHDFPLRWSAPAIVRVKTGNGTVNVERASWAIGEIEHGGREYVFASRLRTTGATEPTAGADLALRVLNRMPQ